MAATDQVLMQRLHGLALALYQAQQDVRAASQRGDQDYALDRMQDVKNLRDLFARTADEFRANDPAGTQISGFDRFLLGVDQWITAAIAALPGAIAAIPRAIGSGLLGAALPWLLGGVVIVAFLKYAEGSRTVRKLT